MATVDCNVEGDSVVVTLPSTSLYLTEDEAFILNKTVLTELLLGLCAENDGEQVDGNIHITTVPVSRADAWAVTKCLDRAFSSEEDAATDDLPTSPELPCIHSWKAEGF